MNKVLRGAVANPEKVYGKSAYEIAVAHGFDGTEEEWLESIARGAAKYIGIAQGTGVDNEKLMSQKAVTETIEELTDPSTFDSHMKAMLIRGGYAEGQYAENTIRVCTYDAFYLPFDAYVEIASGYKVSICSYNSSTPSYENCTYVSNWIDRSIVAMPNRVYSTVAIAKVDNSEITIEEAKNAVTFYNLADINNKLMVGQANSDVMNSTLKALFIQSSINGDGGFVPVSTRVCIPIALKFPNNVDIEIADGYKLAVSTYSSHEIKETTHLTDTGWIESSVVSLPVDTYCAIVFARIDGGDIPVEEAQKAFKFRVPLDEKTNDFYYEGESINFEKHSFKVKEIISAPYTITQGIQGFDIHNGIIAQFEADNMLRFIDIKTGDTLAEYYCAGGHGSSLAFSNNYFEDGDEFPLLYICGGNDPTVYVQRINRTGTSLIARVKYPESVAGYWSAACFDFENKKMYLMGYTENSYSDNTSGKNLMKLTTWDMSQITSNADGTISYALESTKTYPYVYCLQSLSFHDGRIFELISTTIAEDTEIRVIDPASGEVVSRFANFPYPISRGEGEGLSFADAGDSSQMIVCVKGDEWFTYYGFVFGGGAKNSNPNVSDTFSNALKGYATGDAIALKDVSPIEHKLKIKVSGSDTAKLLVQGANLLPYPYYMTTRTINGVAFTDNGDGSITANGTATADARFELLQHAYTTDELTLIAGCYYTLTGCPKGGGYDTYRLAYSSDPGGQDLNDIGDGFTKLCTADAKKYGFYILVKSGVTVNNLVFRPQLEIGQTASPFELHTEPVEYAQGDEIVANRPSMTITTDTEGVTIECEYNRDINKAFAELAAAIVNNI